MLDIAVTFFLPSYILYMIIASNVIREHRSFASNIVRQTLSVGTTGFAASKVNKEDSLNELVQHQGHAKLRS